MGPMKIRVLSFARSKNSAMHQAEEDYMQRIRGLFNFELVLLDAGKLGALPDLVLKRKEAEILLAKLKPDDFLVVLEQSGKSLSSQGLSDLINQHMVGGRSVLNFAIGGAFGWDTSVRTRANIQLSLSSMTFTSQLTELILVEQIYRALTLIKGMPYHK